MSKKRGQGLIVKGKDIGKKINYIYVCVKDISIKKICKISI